MPLFTSEPEPLPIPRSAAHLIPAAVLIGVLAEICVIIGLPWGRWGDPAELQLEWLATWGADLHSDTATTLLAFVAAVLVLYGMSIGGQSTFRKRIERDRTRRSAGALGILVAMSAMALFIFGVSAAISDLKYAPSLVVIVPTTTICWFLGIEVGRYVVPDHRQQLTTARQQKLTLTQKKNALPEDRAQGQSVALIILSRTAAFTVVSMIIVAVTMRPFEWGSVLAAGGVAFIGSGVSLTVYALITASALVEPTRWKRVMTRLAASFMYVLAAVLFAGFMVVVVPTAWAGIAVLLVGLLLAPIGYHVKQPQSGTPRATRTLRAAMVGIEAHSLDQTSNALNERLQELEERARPIRTWIRRQTSNVRTKTAQGSPPTPPAAAAASTPPAPSRRRSRAKSSPQQP